MVLFDDSITPTSVDRDVIQVLHDVDIDPAEFPHVYQWKSLVTNHSSEEQLRYWAMLASEATTYRVPCYRWHTPKSFPSTPRLAVGSPLLFSSPPLSPLQRSQLASHDHTPNLFWWPKQYTQPWYPVYSLIIPPQYNYIYCIVKFIHFAPIQMWPNNVILCDKLLV